MMHLGLPTTEHVLVLLYDAHRTCTLPGRFGVAGLKLGRIGQNKWESASSVWIFREKLKHVLWMGDLNASCINSAAIKRQLDDIEVKVFK